MFSRSEQIIDRFECAWQSGRRPALAAFLRDASAGLSEAEKRAMTIELVKVDLEYRWRNAQTRGRRSALKLEAYVGQLPILGPAAQIPLDLIAEEYRVRRRFGDAPEVQEYFARFSHPRAEVKGALEAVDREIADEGLGVAMPGLSAPRRIRQAVDPQAPLYYGDFVLKRQIGSGGLCRVYAGVQLSLNKEVAIKILRRRFWNSANAVDSFLREAQIVAQLPPEGIVGIHGLGRLPRGGYFMVMDLVDGLDLPARRNAAEISATQAAQWVAAATQVIERVHAAGYIHGDLKPANILVEHGGRVLVTDFGFACALGMNDPLVRSKVLGGTPAFLAPELAGESAHQSSPAIDVFGLGSVLFWLLAMEGVHDPSDRARLVKALADLHWEAIIAPRMPPHTPATLMDLCRRCLCRDPAGRPSVTEVAKELQEWIEEP